MGIPRILIFADESADWRIAGLRQIDRLLLSLNEHAKTHSPLRVAIAWQKDIPHKTPLVSARLDTIHVDEVSAEEAAKEMAFDIALSTRLLVYRGSIGKILGAPQFRFTPQDDFETYRRRLAGRADALPCDYIAIREQIPSLERKFLRSSGKPQDGFVSRYVNRPTSRAVTRQLLKFPITPNAWTLLILALPILGGCLCSRGDYFGILFGTALLQLYSALDGCDGEIARAKFLESRHGREFDTLCDTAGTLLLMAGLGLGLGRSIEIYRLEAVVVASLIVLNDWALFSMNRRDGSADQTIVTPIYGRHLQLWRHSGIQVLGQRVAILLMQLTKRDVAMLAFVILAFVGEPGWILHLSGITAGISLTLSVTAAIRLRSS